MKTLANSLLVALLLGASTLTTIAAPRVDAPRVDAPGYLKLADNNSVRMASNASYRMAMFSTVQSPMKLKVLIEKHSAKPMSILVKDASGEVLGYQFLSKKTGNYSLKFNLSELQDGEYRLEVVSGDNKDVYPLTLSTETPTTPERAIIVE